MKLPEDFTDTDVKQAYRRLARILHPDKLHALSPDEASVCADAFIRVQEAVRELNASPAGNDGDRPGSGGAAVVVNVWAEFDEAPAAPAAHPDPASWGKGPGGAPAAAAAAGATGPPPKQRVEAAQRWGNRWAAQAEAASARPAGPDLDAEVPGRPVPLAWPQTEEQPALDRRLPGSGSRWKGDGEQPGDRQHKR